MKTHWMLIVLFVVLATATYLFNQVALGTFR